MIEIFLIILIIFIFLYFLINKFPYRYIKLIFLLISIILAIIAYNVMPYKSLDLYRHFQILDNTRIYGFKYIINHSDFSNLPIGAIYFYLISLFNNNNLLPAVSSFIYYYSILSIMVNVSQKYKFKKSSLWLSVVLFIFVSNYVGVVSGIRNPLAMSLFVYVIYKELLFGWNKKLCFFLYLMFCLFHPSMLILLIIRLLLSLPTRYSKFISILLLSWSLLKKIIILLLSKLNGISFFAFVLQKFNSYDSVEANAVANVTLYTFVYLTCYLILGAFFIKYYCRENKKSDTNIKKFNLLYNYILCFSLGSIMEYHMFVRFSRVLVMLSAFPIMCYSSCKISSAQENKNKIFFQIIIFLESILFLYFYVSGQYMSIGFN